MTDPNNTAKTITTSETSSRFTAQLLRPGQHTVARALINRFRAVLDKLQEGRLTIVWPDGRRTCHGQAGEQVTLTMRNYEPVTQLLFNGSNGFAESYILGHWEVDDLNAFFLLVMRNERALFDHFAGGWLARLKNTIAHMLKRNSKSGAKKNITFHYDLGNEFYRLWLDDTMVYSSAVFDSAEQSLEQAQRQKMAKAIGLLELRNDHSVLEIGCGWGALSHAMATSAECQVDALSLSHEQLAYARENYSVDQRINYSFKDYRDARGLYDRIVSIEMFEAVGQRYWERYFASLNRLLRSGGIAVLQVITIAEDRFDEYCENPDFIQRYIFPGGMLPTRTHLMNLIKNSGFELVADSWFGQDYATTVSRWRDTFESHLPTVRSLGYDDNFIRMWRYYFAYCEVGFTLGSTDVGMLKLVRR